MSESEKIFDKVLEEWTKKRERNAVPEEFAHMFQPMEIGGGDAISSMFGGSDTMMAVCKRCGAVVYPTALDRHSKFHESLDKSEGE